MITIGCDPEMFLRDRGTKKFVSAFGSFPGTKDTPFALDKGAVQVDGMALEFNIHPASTPEEFDSNIETVLTQITEMVHKVSPDLEMVFEPVMDIDTTYFILQPYDSKVLGCEPDFDENGAEKTPPDGMQDISFRTAAGHVHIGWTKDRDPHEAKHFESCRLIAKEFKIVEGYVPVSANEKRRVKYYGAPGSFRPKSYGVELRSPSNIWVPRSRARQDMFRITHAKMTELAGKYEM